MTVSPTTQAMLHELKTGLQTIYRDRIKGGYLFGSYARGEADPESDVDVLVVLDEVARSSAEVERTGELGSVISLKYGRSISQIFLPEADWVRAETPFLANVREEAVPL